MKTILEVWNLKEFTWLFKAATSESMLWLLSVSSPWLRFGKLLMFFRPCMLGSGQLAAFDYIEDPVEVEENCRSGWYRCGDTSIGMHVKRSSSSSLITQN